MNSFLDNFQPFVVKFTHDMCLPASCRGKYMLCINVVGIKWFEENFITLEYGDGLIEGEILGPNYLMLEDSDANKFDIPRIYVPITEDIVNNTGNFSKFLIKTLTNNSVFGEGIEGFRPSKEYYVNETLYKFCRRDTDHIGDVMQAIIESDDDIYLPDYLYYDKENDIPKLAWHYFEELSEDDKRTKDLKTFFNKNEISEFKFKENDFKFLPQTFFNIILKYTAIQEERELSPNNVYDAVQKYFSNFKTDEGTKLIQTILSTKAKTSTDLNPILNNSCNSCNNHYALNGNNIFIEKSCLEKYKDAMDEWLRIMLGDISYYESWMTVNENDCKYPNFDLIDLLIQLLKEYIRYGKFPSIEESRTNNCMCPSLYNSYTSSDECVKNTMLNYIKLLEWVKQYETVKNTNKIKVYGKEFADFIIKYFN